MAGDEIRKPVVFDFHCGVAEVKIINSYVTERFLTYHMEIHF